MKFFQFFLKYSSILESFLVIEKNIKAFKSSCYLLVNPRQSFNPFIPNAPFLYPLKTSENFMERVKGCIGNKWVKRVIDCFLGTLEALSKKHIDTNESEVKGYRNLLMDQKVLFCLCLMADVSKVHNTSSLTLQN